MLEFQLKSEDEESDEEDEKIFNHCYKSAQNSIIFISILTLLFLFSAVRLFRSLVCSVRSFAPFRLLRFLIFSVRSFPSFALFARLLARFCCRFSFVFKDCQRYVRLTAIRFFCKQVLLQVIYN